MNDPDIFQKLQIVVKDFETRIYDVQGKHSLEEDIQHDSQSQFTQLCIFENQLEEIHQEINLIKRDAAEMFDKFDV